MTPGLVLIAFVSCLGGACLGWALRRERVQRDVQIRIDRATQQLESQQDLIAQLTRQRDEQRETRQALSDQFHRAQRQLATLRETLDEAHADGRRLQRKLKRASEAFKDAARRERVVKRQLQLLIRRTSDNRSAPPARRKPTGIQAIRGIGPKLARQLDELGVRSLHDIATLTDSDIERLDHQLRFRGRIRRDRWVEQARELVDVTSNAA